LSLRSHLDCRAADDPWRRLLERAVPPNVSSISTVALLDLLDVPTSTGNARRLSKTMRAMGFIAIKSRRLMPGGFRDTTIRGWSRPLRETKLPYPTGNSSSGAAGIEPKGGSDAIRT